MDREQPSFPITSGQDKKKKSLKDIKNGTGKTILGSQPDQIDLEPRTTNDKSFAEAKESTAVFTFGRFNPPTVGHEKLINKVANVAKEHNGSAHIFASHTENKSKDPLPQSKKVGYLQKVAGSSADVHGSSKESPSFLHAAKKLHDAGHKHLVMVAGSDRVDEYQKTLNKYNGHPDHFNFKSIKVVSAGQRDPDAEGVEGMSGTKMRALARSGKHSEFKAGLPKALHPHAKEIGDHIRNVPEEAFSLNDILVNEDLRKWFKDKWVRMDTKGNIKGDCAREGGEGKPKCLPLAKARAMDKEDRAAAARRKRREDPVADREGKGNKPINVATVTEQTVRSLNWKNKEPAEYAKHLSNTFGQPDSITDNELVWEAKDGFKRIVVKDEYILHGSPAPHYDFVYCYIDLFVPNNLATALAESSGSILIDFLKGEVGARCGSITANATTLNYVLDVVTGRVKPSKEEYEKRILNMSKMFDKGQKFELDWWPDTTKDADPSNSYFKESANEHFKLCGCNIAEENKTSDLIKKSQEKRGAPGTLKAKINGPITMAKVKALKNKSDATTLDKKQANFYINMHSEESYVSEANKPTNPSLWARAKALARSKFDVYPSAYANGWAAKWYKSKGGGWRSVSEDVLDERVLNIQQRIKRALQMRKIEPKLQRFRELAKRKMAGEPQLKRRAQKMARQVVRRRVAGQRGIDYQKLAPSDKMQIDRQVDKKVALIQALAKRMYPRVRKAEVERLQRARMSMSGMTAPIKPAATPLTMSFDFIDLYMKSAERLTEKDVLSLISKSETSGIDFKTILEVFNQGYDSDISSKPHLSRSQLGFNDVNSYIANHISEVKVDIPAGVESKLKQLVKKMADGKLDEESLGKVTRGGPKKFQVKVKNPKTGNVVTVNFGDPNLSIKRDDPERRKAFRARHNCDTATDRTTPRYWSCRQWRAGAKVEA